MLTSRLARIALFLLLFTIVSNNAVAQVWKAGHGRIIITPKKNIWLSGYGSRNRPAEGEVEKIHCRRVTIVRISVADVVVKEVARKLNAKPFLHPGESRGIVVDDAEIVAVRDISAATTGRNSTDAVSYNSIR